MGMYFLSNTLIPFTGAAQTIHEILLIQSSFVGRMCDNLLWPMASEGDVKLILVL